MDAFEIGRLTDFDFEAICKDIFEEVLGHRLEIFAPGADQGVDLRHLKEDPASQTVIQCKHWLRTGRSKFLSKMRKDELPKVRRLKPHRYIVVTSVELTKAAKDTLLRDFAPYLRSSADIYGLHEVEGELRKRPNIVQRHPRLWLNSTAILQGLMAKEILTRSQALAEDLDRSLETYVPNESLTRAQQILDTQHVVIISGAPGIGKTTLAQVIAATCISQGFSLIEISEDAEEANRLWIDNERQIFYYDDFLGQTTLEDKLNKNEDSRLLGLLRRVNNSPEKRFVLTTREYIFQQASHRYEKLSRADFSPVKCILDLADYTRNIRAQILYNHIFFSDLPYNNRSIFADAETYLPIINHPNFNPRIVRLSLDASVNGEAPDATVQRLLGHLQNPEKIWQHIVEHQLDSTSVSLLEVLFSLGPDTPFEAVTSAWLSFFQGEGRTEQLRQAIKVLEGTLTRIVIHPSGKRLIGFANPSVRDYLREYVSERPELVQSLARRALFFEQIQSLWTIGKGYRGRAILTALCADHQLLIDSVARLLAGPHPRYDWGRDLVGRALTALQIAEHIDSAELAATVDEVVLCDIDLDREAVDGNSAVALISELSKSSFEPLRERAVRLINAAIDYAMADISTWENLEYADSLIAELEDIEHAEIKQAVEAARSSIDDHMNEAASDAFDRWGQYLDEALGQPSSSMEAIVDYASQYDNPGEVFGESYGLIADHIEHIRNLRRESSGTSFVPKTQETASIDIILGSLREPPAEPEL